MHAVEHDPFVTAQKLDLLIRRGGVVKPKVETGRELGYRRFDTREIRRAKQSFAVRPLAANGSKTSRFRWVCRVADARQR